MAEQASDSVVNLSTEGVRTMAVGEVGVFRCICGRECKGRRGVKSHQRTCKVCQSVTSGPTSSTASMSKELLLEDENKIKENPSTKLAIREAPLLGIKLPKTKEQWEEANLFFTLRSELSGDVDNIDSYAANLQSIVYDYFGSTYGILNKRRAAPDHLYSKVTIKQLKLLFAKAKVDAKNNIINGEDICLISRTISHRLAAQKTLSVTHTQDTEKSLKKNFWKTCKEI